MYKNKLNQQDISLTDKELNQFKPLNQVMSPEFVEMVTTHQEEMEKKRTRGKQKLPTKQLVTIRLSPEVVESFKATGKGWQSRINEVLVKYIEQKTL
ncbi:toxin-antitoxin system, antitoxin component [Gallibacterium genomosp. 3]|uniref:Toxin-antitoxin system, antitoxin component n=1 Tax=Gallibacterium genomosp. 3 TaxID=505345 RepID=A0A1A7PVM7_9PAST|nr:BrnA antitoxin family protein [Gallibacterium genomosp. 3]OBX05210.1 toxin-antitoxin system, antitoxin component [Gallibacterium genomosp. 3]